MSPAEDSTSLPFSPSGKGSPELKKQGKIDARNNLDQDDHIDKIAMSSLLTESINIESRPSKTDSLFRLQYRPE
jgi:hypothetical protein